MHKAELKTSSLAQIQNQKALSKEAYSEFLEIEESFAKDLQR